MCVRVCLYVFTGNMDADEMAAQMQDLEEVKILKSQSATLFTMSNDYRADFWEILKNISKKRSSECAVKP